MNEEQLEGILNKQFNYDYTEISKDNNKIIWIIIIIIIIIAIIIYKKNQNKKLNTK